MTGKEIRLRKFFERGRVFILALDHGIATEDINGIERPLELLKNLSRSGVDSMLMTPSMIKTTKEVFFSRSSPLFLARLDTVNVWRSSKKYDSGYYAQVYSVKEAVRAGADGVISFLILGYYDDKVEGYNVEKLAQIRAEAEDYGIPFFIEPVFISREVSDSIRNPVVLKYLVRFSSEIGADVLKVDYAGDKNTFSEVIKASFVPVLMRGGPKTNTEEEFLKIVKDAIDAGAMGATIGRNVWKSKDPVKMARAVSLIIHENISVKDAMKVFNSQGG